MGTPLVSPGPCTVRAATAAGATATRNGEYAWVLMYYAMFS
jgi:hypothetical protein